eukprot:TRINITY_DN40334_c0_g1_i1.p1 TRINITY_DN40334_c0_g1~~TRINITY_DN40334_c0_g1_i1.p1  ORF type:complete len:265 (-),score=50.97 TRINITY_DN40334_c0_g1_i1:247-1041(-)
MKMISAHPGQDELEARRRQASLGLCRRSVAVGAVGAVAKGGGKGPVGQPSGTKTTAVEDPVDQTALSLRLQRSHPRSLAVGSSAAVGSASASSAFVPSSRSQQGVDNGRAAVATSSIGHSSAPVGVRAVGASGAAYGQAPGQAREAVGPGRPAAVAGPVGAVASSQQSAAPRSSPPASFEERGQSWKAVGEAKPLGAIGSSSTGADRWVKIAPQESGASKDSSLADENAALRSQVDLLRKDHAIMLAKLRELGVDEGSLSLSVK